MSEIQGLRNSTVGYTGFHRRIASDNVFGIGYEKIPTEKEKSLQRLDRWKKRRVQLGLNGIRRLKKRREKKKENNVTKKDDGDQKKTPWK